MLTKASSISQAENAQSEAAPAPKKRGIKAKNYAEYEKDTENKISQI